MLGGVADPHRAARVLATLKGKELAAQRHAHHHAIDDL
jgi:hypothetical protein